MENKEYGLIYYDISAKDTKLYFKIHRLMRRTCLPVNMSVYVFDYGLKSFLEQELNKLGAFNLASIQLIKFDPSSKEQIENIAISQLEKIFRTIQANLSSTISKLNNTEKKEIYLERIIRKLKDYENALKLYEFASRVEPALNILKTLVNTEYKILRGKTL